MAANTIILKKGEYALTRSEYKKFQKGDSILYDPEELKRWNIDDKEEALQELAKYRCTYKKGIELYFVEEYALEFCECDSDGEFVCGSDFEYAAEIDDIVECECE